MATLSPLELDNANLASDTFGTIFNKYEGNFDLMKEYLNKIGIVNHVETYTATDGQTEFELHDGTYAPSTGVLEVTVDNIVQYRHEGFEEIDPTHFRTTEPLVDGQIIKAKYYETNLSTRKIYIDSNYSLNGGDFGDTYIAGVDNAINGGNFMDNHIEGDDA